MPATRRTCRHCLNECWPVGRALCRWCYRDPGIRMRYAPKPEPKGDEDISAEELERLIAERYPSMVRLYGPGK